MRTFGTVTAELLELRDWFEALGGRRTRAEAGRARYWRTKSRLIYLSTAGRALISTGLYSNEKRGSNV